MVVAEVCSSMKYPKRCQYKHAKQKKYHVRNWAEYNEGLRRRGDLTVWFDEEAIANWKADKTGKPGGQRVYSDMAIETGLVVRMVYKLAYRQTEGFLHSIASLLGLGIEIPDYSTLCRRSRLLRKKLRIPKAASTQPIHLMIDSTGLRIHVGNARKPPKQRAWRKLHIAVDRETGNIVASELTASRARDATRVPALLTQIQAPLVSVAADSAYDKEAVYEAIEAHSPGRRTRVVIPPQRNATLSQNSNTAMQERDRHIRAIERHGRREWYKLSGYTKRSMVENAVYRYKAIIGPEMRARTLARQRVDEEAIANWKADKTGKPGGQRVYSDMAIETGLVVRMVYKLAYRQTEGFLHSIASLLGLGIEIPDYSTLCRRSRQLRKKLRIPKAASTQPIHLMIDSTGLRIHVGNARKPPKQRAWRKLHIAVDRETGNIVASELTASRARDATRVPALLRWGILTDGARWRLYYQGARSVSEQFFEVDLAVLLDLPGHNDGLFALTETEQHHWLKVFVLVFRREAFLAGTADPRTFHQRAIEEGRFYEERVASSLSGLVFGQVFPGLARAIAAAAPAARLPEVREAALILLYRLLFILYAADRDLLPVRDARYDDYALREKVVIRKKKKITY